MTSIFQISLMILDVIKWFILAHIIFSWLIQFQVLNLRQPFVAAIWRGLNDRLEPIYGRIRRLLPNMGGVDLAPLLVLLAAAAMGVCALAAPVLATLVCVMGLLAAMTFRTLPPTSDSAASMAALFW